LLALTQAEPESPDRKPCFFIRAYVFGIFLGGPMRIYYRERRKGKDRRSGIDRRQIEFIGFERIEKRSGNDRRAKTNRRRYKYTAVYL
jgi:hypothetical protein